MANPVTGMRRTRLGDFVLDEARGQLLGANGPVRIGLKAFRVLAHLSASHGRLVTKEELFDEVWNGTYVSESALTSVIKELRRALGDDPREPRYIASVYGRGYRFLAEPREERDEPAREDPAGTAAVITTDPSPLAVPSPHAPGPEAGPTATVSQLAPRARLRPSRTVLLAATLFVAIAALALWRLLSPHGRAITTVEIGQLRVAPGDTAAKLLRQNLAGDLTRVVVGNDAALRFREDDLDADAGDTADNGGRNATGTADFELSGEAQASGGALHAAMRLVGTADGTILWSRDFDGETAHVDRLRQQMAQTIADVLVCALGGRSRRPADVDQATLKLFLSGCETYHSDNDAARGYFGQVVERRPDFAQARALYASTLSQSVGTFSGVDPRDWPAIRAQARAEAQRAIATDPHVGTAWSVLAGGSKAAADVGKALGVLRKGAAADPDAPELRRSLGVYLANSGFPDAALPEFEKAYALDPFSGINAANLAEAYAYRGRLREADALLEQMGQRWPDEFYTGWERFEITARLKDPALGLAMLDDPAKAFGYRPEAAAQWRALLEARAHRLDPHEAAARIAAEAPGLKLQGQVSAIESLVQLGDLDAAYRIAALIPADKGEWNFTWFRRDMAPFRADPRFQALARRLGLAAGWKGLGQNPEFCTEPGLRWRCPATAAGW